MKLWRFEGNTTTVNTLVSNRLVFLPEHATLELGGSGAMKWLWFSSAVQPTRDARLQPLVVFDPKPGIAADQVVWATCDNQRCGLVRAVDHLAAYHVWTPTRGLSDPMTLVSTPRPFKEPLFTRHLVCGQWLLKNNTWYPLPFTAERTRGPTNCVLNSSASRQGRLAGLCKRSARSVAVLGR